MSGDGIIPGEVIPAEGSIETMPGAPRIELDVHNTEHQYQAIVKVPGSFRPAARNEHLYS